MRRVTAAVVLVLGCVRFSQAEPPQTPYDAVVDTEEVFIKSGPGQRVYYPTGVLKRGERVTVMRHDPGGWFMIAPPPGSFSWISAEHVKRIDGNQGEVTTNTFDHIGSELSDKAHDVRHKIAIGERVEILGEQTLEIDRGQVKMYKIKPPAGEYRWVPGHSVVPADAYKPEQPAVDPFASRSASAKNSVAVTPPDNDQFEPFPAPVSQQAPSQTEVVQSFPQPSNTGGLTERPLVRIPADGAENAGASPGGADDQQRLQELDQEFRAMVLRETSEWDLGRLEQDYRKLHEQATRPATATQVEVRLAAVERYKKIKQEYDEFVRMTSETDQRDAELRSIQQNVSEQPAADQTGPTLSPDPTDPAAGLPVTLGPLEPISTPTASQPTTSPPTASFDPAESGDAQPAVQPSESTTTPAPKFDGAGIILRTRAILPGAPKYVLVAPDGRVLTYLRGEAGVTLEPYVGREVGLRGTRGHRRELRADFMTVREVTLVRLKRPETQSTNG